jgi:predicted Rossmann-fold nucleotide-binding protein
MEVVCRVFHRVPHRKGMVIGVLPASEEAGSNEPREGYPNPWVEIPIHTHLPLSGGSGTEMLSRNHINVLSSTVMIALPGSHGTSSEVELALRYRRPIIAFLDQRDQIENLSPDARVEPDIEKVKEFVISHLPGH